MADLNLQPYTPTYFDRWNRFVSEANSGTIFHRLDFLQYHQEKFSDKENHLMWMKGEHIFSVMPMAVFNVGEKKIAKSPYGGSFGGIVTNKALSYRDAAKVASTLKSYLIEKEIRECIITPPVSILCRNFSETLNFALLEIGFSFSNSDIASILKLKDVDLEDNLFTSNARNMARKGRKEGVEIILNAKLEDFWKVLELTYAKHGTKSTHTFEEWSYLSKTFPRNFWCDVAYFEGKPLAGIGHVRINEQTDSSFYLASDPETANKQGLSLLIYETLLNSQRQGFEYFDFGTSSVNMQARANIFQFKESFGANGYFRHSLKLELI
ncbi:MAG: hypothetical protein IPP77_15365 [Bacteroidetes bacterium]|nr:hypothetical protein [Bacteroidota bacterium]